MSGRNQALNSLEGINLSLEAEQRLQLNIKQRMASLKKQAINLKISLVKIRDDLKELSKFIRPSAPQAKPIMIVGPTASSISITLPNVPNAQTAPGQDEVEEVDRKKRKKQ